MGLLKIIAIVIPGLALAVLLAGQLGLFSSRAPSNLGLRDGKLKPPSKTPNSVSSQANLWPDAPQREYARIEPLALKGDGASTITALKTIVEGMSGAKLIESRPDYLQVQFSTRLMRYTDDAEFWFDPAARMVQVRSASRVGRKDYGVNRARIEAIRARLIKAS